MASAQPYASYQSPSYTRIDDQKGPNRPGSASIRVDDQKGPSTQLDVRVQMHNPNSLSSTQQFSRQTAPSQPQVSRLSSQPQVPRPPSQPEFRQQVQVTVQTTASYQLAPASNAVATALVPPAAAASQRPPSASTPLLHRDGTPNVGAGRGHVPVGGRLPR